MKNLRILFLGAFIFAITGCNGLHPRALGNDPTSHLETQQSTGIRLEELSAESPAGLWEQYFREQGADTCWEQLQAGEDALDFNFERLETPTIALLADPVQANQVAAGILHYLISRPVPVKSLTFKGNIKNLAQQLTILPTSIGQLSSLLKLDLSHNQLQELPSCMGQLSGLQELNLCDNQLQAVPPCIGQLSSLCKLNLSANLLKTFQLSIDQLSNLQELDLCDNGIKEIPPAIGQLRNLIKLILVGNQLQELPFSMGQLSKLQELNIYYNEFQEIPSFINKLSKLQDLNISYNQIQALPASLEQLITSLNFKFLANPFPQPSQLSPLEETSLAAYAYQELPRRSLRVLCSHYIQNHPERYNEEAIKRLFPCELWQEERANLLMQTCRWNKNIVYFKTIKEKEIPFYLDQQLCTPQDVKDILTKLQGVSTYLVPAK